MKKKIIDYFLLVVVLAFFLYMGVSEYGKTRSRLELIKLKKAEIRLSIEVLKRLEEKYPTESKSPNGTWKKNLEVIM